MRRRAFIAGLGSAVAWPIAGRAQQSTKPVIGFLGSTSPEGAAAPIEAVRQSLKDAGVDPRNVQFDYQFAQGHYDRLPVLASELVRKNVAVIIASGSANAAVAAKTATRSIPVVFLNGSDPVVFGLVPNINRPEVISPASPLSPMPWVRNDWGYCGNLCPTLPMFQCS